MTVARVLEMMLRVMKNMLVLTTPVAAWSGSNMQVR